MKLQADCTYTNLNHLLGAGCPGRLQNPSDYHGRRPHFLRIVSNYMHMLLLRLCSGAYLDCFPRKGLTDLLLEWLTVKRPPTRSCSRHC